MQQQATTIWTVEVLIVKVHYYPEYAASGGRQDRLQQALEDSRQTPS